MENFNYRQADIQDIPFDDHTFHMAIANHMLYHVPDRAKAFSEIHRILKNDGIFYAATNGLNHMKEINELIEEFDNHLLHTTSIQELSFEQFFGLHNGEAQLREYFSEINLTKFDSNLKVTNASHLADYIFSMNTELQDSLNQEGKREFIHFLQNKIDSRGCIEITKEVGLFIAYKR